MAIERSYRVLVHGRGLILEFDGEEGGYGFFTTRFVSGVSREEASAAAINMVRGLPKLRGQPNASCEAVEIEEVTRVPDGNEQGLAIYREDGVDGGDGVALADLLPEFVTELEGLLRKGPHPYLAPQVRGLRVRGRCKCELDCATVYCRPRGDGLEVVSVDVEADRGLVVVDVSDGRITGIEILNRPELRSLVVERFP